MDPSRSQRPLCSQRDPFAVARGASRDSCDERNIHPGLLDRRKTRRGHQYRCPTRNRPHQPGARGMAQSRRYCLRSMTLAPVRRPVTHPSPRARHHQARRRAGKGHPHRQSATGTGQVADHLWPRDRCDYYYLDYRIEWWTRSRRIGLRDLRLYPYYYYTEHNEGPMGPFSSCFRQPV